MTGPTEASAEALSASFVELQSLLSETSTVGDFLTHLADLCCRSFPDEVHCSLTLLREGRPETVASSDDLATITDQTQYDGPSGPCLTAANENTEVVVQDLPQEARFGDWPGKAAALGLRSVVALPMNVDGNVVGALNLYAHEPGVFVDGSLVRARVLAATAGGAIEIARRLSDQARLNEDLQAAMASRRTIDQALGIIMAQQQCDAETAFGLLRRTSQNEHRKLRDVAVDLVTTVGGVPPAEAAVFQPSRAR